MWTLAKPSYTATESFEICVSRIKNQELRARMEEVTALVVEASDVYNQAASLAELHLIVEADNIGGQVTRDEMIKLYTGRMVAKKSPGRVIYDTVMALAEHGRCPFCGHRIVSTLDHLLSKSRHPIFAVTPHNLIPCCAECNKAKLDQAVANAEDQYLHPYFDTIENDLWLKAEVVETTPPSLRYFVDPPSSWPLLMTRRVLNHFRRLNLAKLYSSNAAEELSNIQFQVEALFTRSGQEGVKDFLKETHESRSRARLNSWQSALYAALSESRWYCRGGFA